MRRILNRTGWFVLDHKVVITAAASIGIILVAAKKTQDIHAKAMWLFIKEKGLLEEFSRRTDLLN